MTTRSRPLRFALALTTWLLAAASVRAQSGAAGDDAARAAARQLAQEGIEAYWAEKYVEAHEKLEKGYRLFGTPTLGLWSARATMQLGHWVEAAERYRETLTLSDSVGNQKAQREALSDAQTELETLLPRIPTLTLQLEDTPALDVKLTLDGAVLPNAFIGVARPTNPGAHEIAIERGTERSAVQVQLREREHKTLPVRIGAAPSKLSAATPPPPAATAKTPASPQPTAAASTTPAAQPTAAASAAPPAPADGNQPTLWLLPATADATTPPGATPLAVESEPSQNGPWVPVGISALAVGGVAIATAAVTYAVALDTCPDAACTSTSDKDKYDTLQTVSTWSFWPGAVLIAGGAASVWFGLRRPTEREHVRWGIGPGAVVVRGTF